MSIAFLQDEPWFPPAEESTPEGLLAFGGKLTPDWLLAAYARGIFPWFSEGDPVLWWCPDPRLVLFPAEIKVSQSMKQVLRSGKFTFSVDQEFARVIDCCARTPRDGQDGTWITPEVKRAYGKMHQLGHAHSVEVWQEEKLVGGLYGIAMGTCFFGESMFSHASNASKAGFILFARALQQAGFALIDCQVHTPHLESLGARNISRREFLARLETAVKQPCPVTDWKHLLSANFQ